MKFHLLSIIRWTITHEAFLFEEKEKKSKKNDWQRWGDQLTISFAVCRAGGRGQKAALLPSNSKLSSLPICSKVSFVMCFGSVATFSTPSITGSHETSTLLRLPFFFRLLIMLMHSRWRMRFEWKKRRPPGQVASEKSKWLGSGKSAELFASNG